MCVIYRERVFVRRRERAVRSMLCQRARKFGSVCVCVCVGDGNRPNQEILVPDWLIGSVPGGRCCIVHGSSKFASLGNLVKEKEVGDPI